MGTVLFLTALLAGSLTAIPSLSNALETHSTQSQERPETKTVSGTILKSGDKFILSDPATKSKYFLDDQDKASRFEGKHVKVTGRIDAAKNLIHVTSIEEIV